ncbi:MAG: sterol-binding protein [Hamadaea sp.]|nr:sterol-binding protein [Hamadaea sp.]
MGTPTEEFFADLSRRRRDERLAGTTGTVRVDLSNGRKTEHWYLTIADGEVEVGRANDPADSVVYIDREFFDELVTGRANAMAAVLRGALTIEGRPDLPIQLQRIFPGPPDAVGPRQMAVSA